MLALFVSTATFAQVGINADENTIEKDAVLHINSAANTKQGIVIPKVALTGKKEIIKPNATTNTTSLLVWNDGTGGLTPAGFYYWHNDEWNLLNTSSSSTSQEGTFTRNFRKDNRATVKVDKLQDGATPTKDYFVYMDSVQDLILPPPIPDNIGRMLCFYAPYTTANISPHPIGQWQTLQAGYTSCYISTGDKWLNSTGL